MIRAVSRMAILFVFALTTQICSAQVATGTPPYSSLGGGPDVINLANLNSHLTFPVLHKPGRGLPFNFDLTYDSSFWQPVSVNGTIYWEPITTAGWGGSSVNVGFLAYAGEIISGVVYYCSFVYYDGFGTAHPFQGCAEYNSNNGQDFPLTSIVTDGSGYTIKVDAFSATFQLTASDGSLIFPQNAPVLGGSVSPGSVLDRNGNEISVDSSGNFKDTLGVVALKVSGGSPNPYVLSYTSPAGPSAFTVTFKPYTVQTNFHCSGIHEYSAQSASLVDRLTLPDGTFYQFSYEPTPSFPTNTTGRLASVILPTGGQISYTYTGGTNGIECTDGSTSGLTRQTPDGTWTYSRALGTGAASTTTITDPQGNVTVVHFQGIFETQRQIYQGSTTLLETTNTCYNGNTTNCTTTAITLPITQRSTFLLWPNSQESRSDTFYNSYGLETKVTEYDYGNGAPGPLKRQTVVGYASLGAIQNKPATVTIEDGSGTVKAQTTYSYDQGTPIVSGAPQHVAAPGGSVRGNLTTLARLVQGSQTISKTTTYYDTGMPSVAKDWKGNAATTYLYSTAYGDAYPTTVTNALGQHTTYTYDANTGVGTSTTDVNGQVTNYTYDTRLRPVTTVYANGGQTSFSYPSAVEIEVQRKLDNAGKTQVGYGLTDSLGRMSRLAVANAESVPYDQVDICYNSVGLMDFQSYLYQGTGFNSAPVCSGSGDTISYDALGRVTAITHSDGSKATASYTGASASISDEGNGVKPVQRITQTDGLGRLLSVCEISSTTQLGSGGTPTACGLASPGAGFLTTYAKDTLNNLTSISQGGFNIRSAVFDDLSRTTSLTNPESGTTSYTYDANGNVLTSTDARNIVTTYFYDASDRLTKKTYSDGTPTATFTYDSAVIAGLPTPTNTMGRLVEQSTGNTAEVFSYDALGRVLSNAQCTPLNCGTSWVTLNYSYDLLGDLLSSTNGEGVTLTSTYNSAARLTMLQSSLADANHPGTLLSGAHFNAFGEATAVTLGNGINRTVSYNVRGWPVSLSDVNPNTPTPATPGTGAVTFTSCPSPCSGTLTVTVDGFQASTSYGSLTTVASSIAAALNRSGSPVTAVASRGGPQRVTMTSIATGASTNYPFSVSIVGSLVATPLSSALTGGANAGAHTYSKTMYGITNIFYNPNGSVSDVYPYGHDDLLTGYDDLNRMSIFEDSTPSTGYILSFAYDRFGNRWQQNVTQGTATSSMLSFNTNNLITGVTYDAAGNVTADGSHTYRYDAENRLVSIDGGSTATYVYNAVGQRVRRSSGTVHDYIYDLSGHVVTDLSGGWVRGEVFAIGRHIATYAAGTTYFIHPDNIENEAARTDITGLIVSQTCNNQPFGDALSCSGIDPSPLHYTGVQRDSEANLDDFSTRYYSSSTGRFMSADPAGILAVDLRDPQSINRYSYARNNPSSFIDPNGLDGCDPSDPTCGGGGCDPSDPTCGGGGCFFSCGGGGGPINPGPPPPGATPSTFPTAPGINTSWQSILFGPPDPSQLIINNAFPGQDDPCPNVPILHGLCQSTVEKSVREANLASDTALYYATLPNWDMTNPGFTTERGSILREINYIARTNRIIDIALSGKDFASIPGLVEQDKLSEWTEDELANLAAGMRAKNIQKIDQLLQELGQLHH
jgi:RHS repeat-associated protein